MNGPRCPRCLTIVELGQCRSCDFRAAPEAGRPSLLHVDETSATFAQPLDAHLLDSVIPALDTASEPCCTELLMERRASVHNTEAGNPLWEGRADVARAVIPSGGIALDVGCGFGTFAVAMARSAEHVFALDQSPVRAKVTAARLAAEGLENATVLHGEGTRLPLGNAVCDVVTLVGVLEWSGVGKPDPAAAQRRLLGECARVLKPGGVLLIGIENRYGCHYFAGAREEHTNLRFISLIPRVLARPYHRLRRRAPYATLTYSRGQLQRLVSDVGLTATMMVPLPSYSQPQLTLPPDPDMSAIRFYLDHVFQPTSIARRIAMIAVRRLPPSVLVAAAPSYWVVACADTPPSSLDRIFVTGTPYCHGTVKTLDRDVKWITSEARLGHSRRTEPVADGPNARRWVLAPLFRRHRIARAGRLLIELGNALGTTASAPVGDSSWKAEALEGLARLRVDLSPTAQEWCRALVESADRPEALVEHGDLSLNNIVVSSDGLKFVDLPGKQELAPRGRDEIVAGRVVLGALGT